MAGAVRRRRVEVCPSINLPIVRIDPNSHRQHHQPIAIPRVILALATATYQVLVVVETKLIHEYTTERNVDNLWWNLLMLYVTLNSIAHAISWNARERGLVKQPNLLALEPFRLIAFIAQSTTFVIWNFLIYLSLGSLQLLFRYHHFKFTNETFVSPLSICLRLFLFSFSVSLFTR
jgi:hypothetical protein